MYTLSLSDIDASFTPISGGKGAMLGQLMHLLPELGLDNIAVPAGISVTVNAFEEWLKTAGIEDARLSNALEACGRDVSKLEKLSVLLQHKLQDVPIPAALEEELTKLLVLDMNPAHYAVRSSGIGEDGENLSFAGQHDSVLNLNPRNAIAAIPSVWKSAFHPRALYYRVANGILDRPIRQAVVIQEMVQPDFAGVVFSVNPQTGIRDTGLMEYVQGLGDKLVDGSVNPYRLNFHHDSPESVGNNWSPISLSALRLQELLGYPVDIEWAIKGGVLYLLQVRPITSLPEPHTALEFKLADLKHSTYGAPWLVGEPFSAGQAKAVGFISREQAMDIIENPDPENPYALSTRILLVSHTTPDDEPIMHKVAGIVVSKGGMLSHAAILGREMQKPVIKIPSITKAKHKPTVGQYVQNLILLDGELGAIYKTGVI